MTIEARNNRYTKANIATVVVGGLLVALTLLDMFVLEPVAPMGVGPFA